MSPTKLDTYLRRQRRLIEAALESRLPTPPTDPLDSAIRYALLGGGKRLRPVLTLATCEAVGADAQRAMPLACAIEMVHAYSLVHDDLPAMDDDDLRRGKPTVHVAYGEAIAILAGDALLTDAFALAAGAAADQSIPAALRLRLLRELARAAGSDGMIRGQARDIGCAGAHRTPEALEETHRRKTGDLIRCAVRMGAMVAGARQRQLAALTAYAEALGLAFQVTDDLLDAIATTSLTGKRAGRDATLNKVTYPALLGIDAARARARELVAEALDALRPFDERADALRGIVRHTVQRVPGEDGSARRR